MTSDSPDKSDKRGEKRMRGVPVHYDELKKQHGIWLTGHAWEKVKSLAKAEKVSVGEYLERMIRGIGD